VSSKSRDCGEKLQLSFKFTSTFYADFCLPNTRRNYCMLFRSVFSFGMLAVMIAGCSSGVEPEIVPPLEPVSGKVLIDGKPAAGVAVTFVPAENNKGNPCSGSTDANGAFSLVHRSGSPGVPAGDYVVVFSKLTQPDGTPIPEGQTAADVMAVDQIPEKYRQIPNFEFTFSVPTGGKTFDFELTSS
jgi:hypothetical protein